MFKPPGPGGAEQPLLQGSRLRAACDRCHYLKNRCVRVGGPDSRCERCERLDNDCVYRNTAPMGRKRKSQSGAPASQEQIGHGVGHAPPHVPVPAQRQAPTSAPRTRQQAQQEKGAGARREHKLAHRLRSRRASRQPSTTTILSPPASQPDSDYGSPTSLASTPSTRYAGSAMDDPGPLPSHYAALSQATRASAQGGGAFGHMYPAPSTSSFPSLGVGHIFAANETQDPDMNVDWINSMQVDFSQPLNDMSQHRSLYGDAMMPGHPTAHERAPFNVPAPPPFGSMASHYPQPSYNPAAHAPAQSPFGFVPCQDNNNHRSSFSTQHPANSMDYRHHSSSVGAHHVNAPPVAPPFAISTIDSQLHELHGELRRLHTQYAYGTDAPPDAGYVDASLGAATRFLAILQVRLRGSGSENISGNIYRHSDVGVPPNEEDDEGDNDGFDVNVRNQQNSRAGEDDVVGFMTVQQALLCHSSILCVLDRVVPPSSPFLQDQHQHQHQHHQQQRQQQHRLVARMLQRMRRLICRLVAACPELNTDPALHGATGPAGARNEAGLDGTCIVAASGGNNSTACATSEGRGQAGDANWISRTTGDLAAVITQKEALLLEKLAGLTTGP